MYPREIEASVQMRLYTLSKRHFVIVFFSFFFAFGISIIVGVFGPPILIHSVQNVTSPDRLPSDMQNEPFVMRSPALSVFHQQLWLTATVLRKPLPDGTTLTIPFRLGVEIRGVMAENAESGSRNSGVLIFSGGPHNRTRDLVCVSEQCEELLLAHLSHLDYTYYVFQIRFHSQNPRSASLLQVRDIQFTFHSYHPNFTQLEIWYRFILLLLGFIATLLFSHSLRRFLVRDWSIEQRWMSVLLPLLLLYNNPFLPLTFLVNSWIPGMLDAVFQATFLVALLLFWLCIYHGVRQNERMLATFYLPKLVVVGMIWLSAVLLASWQTYQETYDPTFYYRLDMGNFMIFKIVFLCIGVLYIIYLLYLLVRAYAELRTMAYFNVRLKFLTGLMLLVVIISLTITALRFGTRIVKDNFIAELTAHYGNSVEFSTFYGLLNFYLFTMAYVYSPSKNAVRESHFKDNPTISMMNDSDEEVIYGSDGEETNLMSEHQRPK